MASRAATTAGNLYRWPPHGSSYAQGWGRRRSPLCRCPVCPGFYEVIIAQRPIAVHALENPMKADGGVYLFRKLLRDAITGDNKEASPAAFKKWMEELDGHPPSYCCGNIIDVPEAATQEEEV
jgi:hypothetical protein